MVCHAEYEAKHRVACDFTNEIVLPALKSAKSCQTVNIAHLSEQKVIFYCASFTPPARPGSSGSGNPVFGFLSMVAPIRVGHTKKFIKHQM